MGRDKIVPPAICCSVIGKDVETLENLSSEAIDANIDILEVRLDKLKDFSDLRFLYDIDLPIILTNRTREEGGYFKGKETERVEIILESLDKSISCVDIALSTPNDLINRVMDRADKENVSVILSFHDFEKVPSEKELDSIVKKMEVFGPDFKKIIGFSNNLDESMKILKFLIDYSDGKYDDLISFAMGEKGEFTRIASPVLGSILTYGSIGEKTAPGQLNVSEIKDSLNKYRK